MGQGGGDLVVRQFDALLILSSVKGARNIETSSYTSHPGPRHYNLLLELL